MQAHGITISIIIFRVPLDFCFRSGGSAVVTVASPGEVEKWILPHGGFIVPCFEKTERSIFSLERDLIIIEGDSLLVII